MRQRFHTVKLRTTAGTDILDITGEAQNFIKASGLSEGLFTASVPGSTAGVTTIEFESGVVQDLVRAIERLVPAGMHYDHDARWGDGNGFSHVRAALMKPSLSIPVREGELALGTWQQLVLLDFDNKPRHREVILHVMGE